MQFLTAAVLTGLAVSFTHHAEAIERPMTIAVFTKNSTNPAYAAFLIGIGVRTLSLDARYIPKVQEALLALKVASASVAAERLLSCVTIAEVEAQLGRG